MPKIICSKNDWLILGLSFFCEGGPNALNIEKMSKWLGCAKTSFYNYFENRELFLSSIIDYWIEYTTVRVKNEMLSIHNPMDQLKHLITRLFTDREIKNFYFYFRELAQTNKKYRDILNENERLRINSLTILLESILPNKKEASMKAEIFYDYFFGWYERNKHLSINPESQKKQMKLVSSLLGIDLLAP